MSVPYYQIIKVHNPDPRVINGQLLGLDFDKRPIVLDILDLAQQQKDALKTIDEFFQKYGRPRLPYSVYILSDFTEFKTPLFIVPEKSKLPQFFNKKSKSLNSKENSYLSKIELKQENFRGLVNSEYETSFENYAYGHRQISQKENFAFYLETINKGLKDYYGKKE